MLRAICKHYKALEAYVKILSVHQLELFGNRAKFERGFLEIRMRILSAEFPHLFVQMFLKGLKVQIMTTLYWRICYARAFFAIFPLINLTAQRFLFVLSVLYNRGSDIITYVLNRMFFAYKTSGLVIDSYKYSAVSVDSKTDFCFREE